MKTKRTFVFITLFFPLIVYAQTYTIKGVITDEKGRPASNAKVVAPGSDNYSITNESGEFILNNVPAGKTQLEVIPTQKQPLTYNIA